MNLRVLAAGAALLGGLAWAARWVAELDSGDPAWGPRAHVAGLVLLGLALAGAGAGLVSSSAAWLRLIVAVAFPALVWSVWSVVRGEGESVALDGIIGAVAVLMAVVGLVMARRASRERRRRRSGSHAR